MALVNDVLIVEVIEEVIIFFVLEGNQTVPNILCIALKPLVALSRPEPAICTEHTNRMQHQRTPEEIEIFTKIVETLTKLYSSA